MKLKNINKGIKCYLSMDENRHLSLSLFLDKETLNDTILNTGKQSNGIFKDIIINEKYEGFKSDYSYTIHKG